MGYTDQPLAGCVAARARLAALVSSGALLLAALLGSVSARAADEQRTIVLLQAPEERERIAELRLALDAHLSGTPIDLRVHEQRDQAAPAREVEDIDRIAREQQATTLVWLAPDGEGLFVFTPGRDTEPRLREVPDYGEGWASRCEAMATIIVSDLESDAAVEGGDRRAWLLGLAPRIGLGIPTSKLGPAVIAGLEVDLFLPVLDRRLVVAVDASVTRPEHEGVGNDPRVGGEYEYSVGVLMLKFSVDLIFRFFERSRRIVPFVGIGPVIQVASTTERTSFTVAENRERSVEFGGELLGGADLSAGPGAIFVELRLALTGLDQRFTGDTNGGVAGFTIGYRFIF